MDEAISATPSSDKRRPVLVITRNEAISALNSVATFDNIASLPKALLTTHLGTLGPSGHQQICAALDALANC